MTTLRKFGLTLVAVFGLAFAASTTAIAAPLATQPAPGSTTLSQHDGGDDHGVDCEEFPDHPDCQEGAPR